MMKYLPTDLSTFSTMIQGDYLYVDKTKHIYDMFSGGSRLYFLSRPRRFGKSLLISTLAELFSGNRDLFKGLWIESSNYQWITYPIIRLDFSEIKHDTIENFNADLLWKLKEIGSHYGITLDNAPTINSTLSFLIKQLAIINKVVILIDEYDKPILDHLTDYDQATRMRTELRGLYEVIKACDPYIRAVFITGVTKFAKTSIFSGMNNLNDISHDEHYASLLGYTQEELANHFLPYIHAIAAKNNLSEADILHTIQRWYNGYRFSESPIKVYNPFSVLYYFSKQKLANYWFKSGTPTFLIHLIKQHYIDLAQIPTAELKSKHLESFELNNITLIPLLFQTGYLTISHYNPATNRVTLNYPNYEVEESFTEYIVASLTDKTPDAVDNLITQIIHALSLKNMDAFCSLLQNLFARIPYTLHIHKESYYHSLFHFLMNLLILETQSEVLTNQGRIDTVLHSNNHIYIFELKINKKPEEALEQILHKKYYEAYHIFNKPIILVGISFIIQKNECLVQHATKEL